MANWFWESNQTRRRRRSRRLNALRMEALENRFALTGFCDLGTCLSIEMLPEFDTFGNQIETIQAYGEGDDALVAISSIYDTGASVITWSANDQALFQFGFDPLNPNGGIPVKVPGGAEADAIGGKLIGDVSEPGVIRAEGLHALNITGGLEFAIEFQDPARAEGVQSFIGTTSGSPSLPTITGVPIHYPSPAHTTGVAARIDMNAFEYDLGALFPEFGELFQGLSLFAPDIFFVDPDQDLETSADGDTTNPVRVPLSLIGGDNHADPGDLITYTNNPVQEDVFFADNGAEVNGKTMLFDTGAQLSVVSTEIALQLGFNLDSPTMTIDVQGAAGSTSIPGYFIDELQLPLDNDGNGIFDGGLQFNNVPIFVLDLGFGLDGILGMNLFNTADVMLYDPFDSDGPSLQTRFFTDLVRESITLDEDDGLGTSEIDLISQAFPTMAGSLPSGSRSFANLGLGNPVSNASVVGRQLFLNDSGFDGFDPGLNAGDDAAIATNFAPLYPGGTGNSENILSSAAGITGVMIDVHDLADPAAFSTADLEFRFGTSGNPSSWNVITPESIAVRENAGLGGSDRISVAWNSGELTDGWLEVRVEASEAAGLEFDDVFYFGSKPADVNGDGSVDAIDFASIRANPHNFTNPSGPADAIDLNHDGNVNATDMILVRDRVTGLSDRLTMLQPPPVNLGKGFVASLNAPVGSSVELIILPETATNTDSADEVDSPAIAIEQSPSPVDTDSVDRLMAAYATTTIDPVEVDLPTSEANDEGEELEIDP